MPPAPAVSSRAFTLVELLVSMTVLALIMVVSASVINITQKTWSRGSARTEQFREARVAFETITQSLRQATLNPYTTYRYASGSTVPTDKLEAPQAYVRHSELQFVTGPTANLLTGASGASSPLHAVFFQAPLGVSNRDGYEGLTNLLCGRGYFVTYGDDAGWRPTHVSTSRVRYRLMEYRPPSERNTVYSVVPGAWFADALSQVVTTAEVAGSPAYTRPIAENILALVISPRVAPEDLVSTGQKPTWIAPNYAYDSTVVAGNLAGNDVQGTQHLLPPVVIVTLVAIDEVSANKLAEQYGATAPPLFAGGLFTNTDAYESDLATLEASLVAQKLTYRVFSSAVSLRNAKWKHL